MHPTNFLRILTVLAVAVCTMPAALLADSTATKGAIGVQANASPADLALLSVRAPGRFGYIFDPYPITIDVKNIGGKSSGDFRVNFYASEDTRITLGDRRLGDETFPGLAPGETKTFTSSSIVWFFGFLGTPKGPWYIGAIITLKDSNSGNNVNFDPLPVNTYVPPAFKINEGLNDTWHNKDTGGQGFFINVFPATSPDRPEPVMFVGWFTYDTQRPAQDVTAVLGEPGHRWLTAYGPYSADTATLDIELTQGGTFNSSVPAPTQGPYGTMTVKFANCSEGEVTYNIPSVGVSGKVPITRVANDNVPLCESLEAKLQQNP